MVILTMVNYGYISYNTRSSNKGNFYIKPCSSKMSCLNVSNIGVRLWNNLNENIRTSRSFNIFKKKFTICSLIPTLINVFCVY